MRNLLFVLLVPAFCLNLDLLAQKDLEPVPLFPESGTFEGWNRMDSIAEYAGETMQEWLGEVTPLYVEYGLERFYIARYSNQQATKITLEVYHLEDPNSAWGLFTMNSSGRGSSDTLGDVSMLYDHFVHLVKGPYYIKCMTSRKSDTAVRTIRAMGSWVAGRIDQHAKKPPLLVALEKNNAPFLYGKYFKGQRGLSEFIDFGHGSIAGFKEGALLREEEALYQFVFSYDDERTRREWFASAKGKMKMNHKYSDYKQDEDGFTVLDRNGNTFTFKPYRKFILVVKDNNSQKVNQKIERIKSNLDRYVN